MIARSRLIIINLWDHAGGRIEPRPAAVAGVGEAAEGVAVVWRCCSQGRRGRRKGQVVGESVHDVAGGGTGDEVEAGGEDEEAGNRKYLKAQPQPNSENNIFKNI